MFSVDFPHMAPSVCFVCEGAEPGAQFVDTARSTNFAPVTHLDGRKYVCSNCVRDSANVLGLFDEAKAVIEYKLILAEAKIEDLNNKIQAFAHVADAVDTLAEEKVKAAKTATKAKK